MTNSSIFKSLNTLIIILFTHFIHGQNASIKNTTAPHIKTIQLHTDKEVTGIPIIKLGTPFKITFDDINGDEADYYYRIKHCDFNWEVSSLFKNEYLNGFDEIRIINYTNSFNTLQMYSNYSLSIPNEDTKGLKVSGNYLIEFYDDDDEVIFTRKLIVYNPTATVQVYPKRSRDLKYIDSKQSVQFEINSPKLLIRNPHRSLNVLVMQNNDIENAITDLKPQYTLGSKFIYKYDQESCFNGSNEFLSFDNKDIRAATNSIKRIELKEIYNNILYTDVVRANRIYTFNPEINGNFVVRNLDADDPNTQADYAWMHFSLQSFEPLNGGDIHLYGNFNNYKIDDTTLLKYDKEKGVYYTKRLFKQGYYNYKYILVKPDNTIDYGAISGNFDETENEYNVIVYYRAPTGRFDKVIGVGSGNSRNITN